MKIKFAHVADCHLGAWRKETLNQIGYNAFDEMISSIIKEKVEFVLISGDLYDTSNPKVEVIDLATQGFKRLEKANIPTYGIMGSHDFSPSNRSMLRPLFSAELFVNVSEPDWGEGSIDSLKLKFFQDKKTKIKITGMRARKRSLELEDYRLLDRKALEEEEGTKIFLLHTMLSELKPKEFKDMESGPKSILPRDFFYYAGGHLHKTVPEELRTEGKITISSNMELQQKIVYPGGLYPINFRELEEYHYGGYCIVEGDISTGELTVSYKLLKMKEVVPVIIDANNKSIQKVKEMVNENLFNKDIQDKVVTIRIAGELASGNSYEINVNEIIEKLKEKEVYEVLINKAQLVSRLYESIKVDAGETNEEIEKRLITEHAQKSGISNLSNKDIETNIYKLIEVLGRERKAGEVVKDHKIEIWHLFSEIMSIQLEGED